MPQADGRNKLQRMALQMTDGTLYRFLVNPQNYEIHRPQRSAVFKTRTHVVVEDYGPDIPTISFSGTTGFRVVNGKSGADRLKDLQAVINDYANSGHAEGTVSKELYFHNFTDGESYVVHLEGDGLTVTRSAENPLLYEYQISLYILREAHQPDPDNITTPRTGNFGDTSIGLGKAYRTSTEVINPNSNNPNTGGAVSKIDRSMGIQRLPN